MRIIFFLSLCAATCLAVDPSPIGTFSHKGKTLPDARVSSASPAGVVVIGKGGQSVTIPWASAIKDPQIKSRIKDEIAASESAPNMSGGGKIFKVSAVLPDGLICIICREEYRNQRSASGQRAKDLPPGLSGVNYGALAPVKVLVETKEEVFVQGYQGEKNVATGEIFNVATDEGGIKNLGPSYGNRALRIHLARK